MVGVEFADNETALDFGCGGQFMVIESEALWDYIVNVAEVHRVTELTPTMAFGYLFGDTLTKMMVNSHYYDTECACAITKNNRVVAHLSSYFQNYEWEKVEKPFISSTDEWVRFESTADATELIFWNEGEGIIECRLPNYGEGSPIYWQAKPKENVEMSNSFFTNAWKLCLDECIMNGYMKNHNAESLTKLIGLMNLEELFADYDGNTICHHFVDNTVGTMQRDDIVYYRTEETDMQKIVQTMFSVMLDALLEPSENRPYTVTQYRLDEMEIIQGSENIWFIPFVKGAYKYDGVDLVTFEEQLPYTTVYEDGLIPLFGQGSDSMFYYILIRNEGVYRLERGGKFASKYDYLLNMEKLEETAEYTESVKFETEADLNQDGLVDKIALVMYKANEAGDFGELIANLRNTSNYVRVKAYYGIGYNDFSKEPFYISEKFGMHAENKGTIGLTTWNGKDYLFTAHMNEAGEEADYSYTLFNFENGEETIAVFDQVQFSMKDNPYAWVEDGLEFHTNFSQQVCEGIILAGFDADEIVTAQSGVQTDASTYFNCIWNCGSVTPSRLMKEQLRKLGLEKEIVLSEKAEFIAQVDAQMADYFKKRETSYYTNDSLTERGRALDAWEKRLRFRIEDAQIGYCYGSLYDVSERKRVVYVSEVGFMDCYYSNEEAYEKHFINTEHLFTFELENGQWKLVSDAYAETHLGYQQELGLADWEVYLYGVFGGELDLENLYTLRNMDLHVWFEDYNGEEIQCIRGAESDSPAIRGDIVYYHTKENDAQVVLKRMIEEMVNPLMIASEERPYTITKYRIDDSQMYQVNENIWYVTYLNGYYKYEGLDMAPFETRLQEEAVDADGLVSFERQGSDTVFSYVLLKEGDVYCLRRFGSMDIGYEALNYEESGME